ncbi:GNAT family N-acetyltransferase [Salipiger sp.]|uniref:GNAT family N-acetyltransferase n=1 Tax=Salipiger sp. TaxID=2078585 RepID=UPI003A96CED1
MIDTCTSRDLPQLAPLLRGLNALHAAHVPTRFHAEAGDEALRAHLGAELERGARVLGYRAGGVLRGYLLWRMRDVPASALEHRRSLGVLEHVFVAPTWRRRGIARRLVARFETMARAEGAREWVVTWHVFNAASEALMRGAGADPAVVMAVRRF